ncbi:MAG: FAD-dependent oxidoreductase [Spirulinaceae cyanobacterium]
MNNNLTLFDVAVVGAGLAGLSCAKELSQLGCRVVVLDKSRGLGGRVATRRINNLPIDHGLPYLQPQGKLSQQLIQRLNEENLIQPWHSQIPDTYIAPQGMTAIAKFMARDLEVWRQSRVEKIEPIEGQVWHLSLDSQKGLTAKAVVMAIPAPQALTLLEPLTPKGLNADLIAKLHQVKFDPCLSVMAGYKATIVLPKQLSKQPFISIEEDSYLAWLGLDSSKRTQSQAAVLVIRSTAEFAQKHLETTNLAPAAQQLISRAGELFTPELKEPQWYQIHRWRFSIPHNFINELYLATHQPLPLICCGDWCGGNSIESALASGLVAATQISNLN